mmetsp:Transcript_15573/g.30570  ORF Transcript_15573/g.30570 Transcript_15573/m.30570 type:complete len:352 (+) Transcript_15573:40-1095(+)
MLKKREKEKDKYDSVLNMGGSSSKGRKTKSGSSRRILFGILVVIIVFLVYDDMSLRKRISAAKGSASISTVDNIQLSSDQNKVLQDKIDSLELTRTTLQAEINAAKDTERTLEDEVSGFQTKLAALHSELEAAKQASESNKGNNDNKVPPVQFPADSKVLKDLIRMEKLNLKAKYGEGPAMFTIETELGTMTLETAPFDVMPHIVSFWLNQVESGYWDGCAFVRNADHVLQANCGDRRPSHPDQVTVAFQEYSDQYTHEPYTLGLAGFPAGTDFYVNLVDNVRNHGPGGQDPVMANPCYAKIVKGREVIEKIKKKPRDSSDFQGLVNNVRIIKMRVLGDKISGLQRDDVCS